MSEREISAGRFDRASAVTHDGAERSITVALPSGDYQRFEQRAKARGISKTALARKLILDFVSKPESA